MRVTILAQRCSKPEIPAATAPVDATAQAAVVVARAVAEVGEAAEDNTAVVAPVAEAAGAADKMVPAAQ